jgi:hypothetical protein
MQIVPAASDITAKPNLDPEPEDRPDENDKSKPGGQDDHVDYGQKFVPLSPEQRKASNWAHPEKRWHSASMH